MKQFNILVAVFAVLVSCQTAEKREKSADKKEEIAEYATFGAELEVSGARSDQDMLAFYQQLKDADTVSAKFTATVVEVCQTKGCWMKLKLDDGEEAMVRFKDYGFFVPKDIAGKEVVVSGNAFVDMMSVEDQQHYAEDEGKSAEEIAQITSPKKTYSFEAAGVKIKQ